MNESCNTVIQANIEASLTFGGSFKVLLIRFYIYQKAKLFAKSARLRQYYDNISTVLFK